MRQYKLKKCNRIAGLTFTPDGRRLVVLGGYEAQGVETAVWLDPASGNEVRVESFGADGFHVPDDRSRLVVLATAYDRADRAEFVRWLDLGADAGDWQSVDVGVKWDKRIDCLMSGGAAFYPHGTRLLVEVGRRVQINGPTNCEWRHQFAVCPVGLPGKPTTAALTDQHVAPAVHPSGRRFAASTTVDDKPVVVLYDEPGGEPVARFRSPSSRNPPGLLRFSPDGRVLAALSAKVVHLLAADTLAPVADLVGHPKRVNALAFTADGRRLLTACHDGQVRAWDATTGGLVKSFDWQVGMLTALAVAPDGLTWAAGGAKGQLVVWDADE